MAISTVLRWEIASGRAIGVRRGIYRYGHAPRTTLKRIRRLSQYCQDWIVALTRSPHQHNTHHWPRPWWSYAWLWQI